jgi:uncharacterized membrane protein YdbT with pleckstrin-like domain
MSYIDNNLIPGETVMYRTRLHWIVVFWHVLLAVIFGLAGAYLLSGMPGTAVIQPDQEKYARIGGAVLLVFALISIVISFVRRNSVEMAVTNKRVTVKVGLMSRSTEEMMLSRIESIMVHQTVMGRMLGYGTITLRGVGGTPDPFPSIAHPLEFRRQVQQQLDALQGPAPLQASPRPLQ